MTKQILSFCFFLFFLQNGINAASIKGGSIAYTCLGNNKYKITARVNRECSGAGISTYQMNVFNGVGTAPMSASRVSIMDVSPVCSKVSQPCTNPNGVSAPGIEEHVYEATVDFNSMTFNPFLKYASGNCRVYFSFECADRDSLNTMSHGQFFIVAMLDLCLIGSNACNTSPAGKDISTVYGCCNQPFSYNPGLHDMVDNDSVTIDTLTPKTGKNSIELLALGYSQKYLVTPYCPPAAGIKNCNALPNAKPPRGIYFDPNTGEFTYTPTLCDERSAIVFRAYEYRRINGKSELVGFSEKEVGFTTVICNDNNLPSFTGSNKFSLCEGNNLCFTVSTKDDPFLPKQTVPDTVELSWDSGITAATFTIVDPSAREREAQFCWQTKIGDARSTPYNFIAKAKDDYCPHPAGSIRVYSITVKPKARDTRKYTKSFRGWTIFEAIVTSDSVNYPTKNYTYKYTIRDSTNSGIPLFTTFNRKDSFKFTKAGTYIIQHEIYNPPLNCPTVYFDTFKVTSQHLTAIAPLSNQRISIMPNPGHDILTLVSEDLDLSGISVKIYSIDGKIVYETIPENSQINVSALSKGMYIVEINSEGLHLYQRVVIE